MRFVVVSIGEGGGGERGEAGGGVGGARGLSLRFISVAFKSD